MTVLMASHAFAWGATGHRLIGEAALAALPDDLPAFLREAPSIAAVGELAREPDRWKGAGRIHDTDRDGAHFLDLGDDGRVLGGPALADLPATREAYDAQLRAAGSDSWKAGWLPYAIIDAWQQLGRDFGYWRIDAWAAREVADPAHRAWFAADLAQRRSLVLEDLGALAHYVGDGSQPLHVSIHFNGWGDYPNPQGFTQARIHALFEGAFVHDQVTLADVEGAMTPYADCRCAIAKAVADYLAATHAEVETLYRLDQDHAFAGADPRGRAFAAARLGVGAAELRTLVVEAWRGSGAQQVGWPALKVGDVESGRFDPYASIYGSD